MYVIEVFLVGVTYYSLKNLYRWKISPKKNLFILFLTFMFLDNYLWAAIINLDVSFTVGNESIAKAFNLKPNEPAINLFGFGWFEFISWSVEALAASYIGEKLFKEDSVWNDITKNST